MANPTLLELRPLMGRSAIGPHNRPTRRATGQLLEMRIKHPFCNRAHELDGSLCFRISDTRRPRTPVASTNFIPKSIHGAREVEHGTFNLFLRSLSWLNWMLRS